MPEVHLLNVREAAARCGISRTKVYELLKEGRFPRPVYPAPGSVRWRSDEIADWIDQLSAERAA